MENNDDGLINFDPKKETAIGDDLEKLFAFQDKHLSKEKKGILVRELMESRLPTGAIVLGLRDLMSEDLNTIKMGSIFAAARRHLEKEDLVGCTDCASGFVVMKDDEGRSFSLACRCGAGGVVQRANGMRRWSGDSSQMSNGRFLHKA